MFAPRPKCHKLSAIPRFSKFKWLILLYFLNTLKLSILKIKSHNSAIKLAVVETCQRKKSAGKACRRADSLSSLDAWRGWLSWNSLCSCKFHTCSCKHSYLRKDSSCSGTGEMSKDYKPNSLMEKADFDL